MDAWYCGKEYHVRKDSYSKKFSFLNIKLKLNFLKSREITTLFQINSEVN